MNDQERCAIEASVIHTSRCAARLARKALWTSLARLGGRLSLRLRPRLEDIAGTVEGDREGNWGRGAGNGAGEGSSGGLGNQGRCLRQSYIDALGDENMVIWTLADSGCPF